MKVYTATGRAVELKEPAMKSGGEGAVYEIQGYPRKVAKLYHDLQDAKKREKKVVEMARISNMPAFLSTHVLDHVAWPLAPLYDARRRFIGFGMDRIQATTELDDLYVYPPVKNANMSIAGRLDCLISLCDNIDKLHSLGQVFGDFNPNNIKIRADHTVCFVDADSYHVHSGGKEFRCVVCAPGYVAPELIRACKGTTYEACPGRTFTQETDRFALAIHCFRMLMNGCHPFVCQRQLQRVGSAPAPKSTDARVERGETPFFKAIPNYTTPSYAPNVNALPPYIRALFKRAFVDGHTAPKARPTAGEWKKALRQYRGELVGCKANPAHFYWKENRGCPYCEADKRCRNNMAGSLRNSAAATPTLPKVRPKLAPQNVTTAGAGAAAAARAHAPAYSAQTKAPSFVFWAVTVGASALLLAILSMELLPQVYDAIAGEALITQIGTVGSCIAGMVGTALYNSLWAPGIASGKHKWYEYLLSVLTALAFAAGFGVALLLACIVIAVVVCLVAGAVSILIAIAFIVALFSGG